MQALSMTTALALAALLLKQGRDLESERVLVVANVSSPQSLEVAEYYRSRRSLAAAQVVKIDVSTCENVSWDEYRSYIETPLRAAISKYGKRVDYIVLTKGIPHKVADDDASKITDGYAVDACLAGMDLDCPVPTDITDERQTERAKNPYYGVAEAFDSSKFKVRLVTRLDGYTTPDCKALVDRALGARAERGLFLSDLDTAKDGPGYDEVQRLMERSQEALDMRGYLTRTDTSAVFVREALPLAGYSSWGSNDSGYDTRAFRSLRFHPGSIADVYVSDSARTFLPENGGHSMVGDLVRQGATGVKGYVSEPSAFGLTRPNILFDRYATGFNLAESFWMATPLVKWKDVVIGDPLCRPYRALP